MKVKDRVRVRATGVGGVIVDFIAGRYLVELDEDLGCKGCGDGFGRRMFFNAQQLELKEEKTC